MTVLSVIILELLWLRNRHQIGVVFLLAVAEALGIQEALSWIKRMDFGPIIIETITLLVVNAISHSTSNVSSLGLVIEDCIALLKYMLGCKVSFVKSLENHVAYTLVEVSDSMFGP